MAEITPLVSALPVRPSGKPYWSKLGVKADSCENWRNANYQRRAISDIKLSQALSASVAHLRLISFFSPNLIARHDEFFMSV